MAKAKTTETGKSVPGFIKSAGDKERQNDCLAIIAVVKKASGLEPKMWGPSIVGFGSYHYKYESGHEGDAPLFGFSPRKSAFSLYIANFDGKEKLLKEFGKYKMAKSCVYIHKVADIDLKILEKLVCGSIKFIRSKYK